ncbi:hypothetical protein FRB95_001278 [Tulasnella sp. JGI-2019a]|nr:hypothetical protein FRB95_001278 [Tulasnella sp. JGI-2019a]
MPRQQTLDELFGGSSSSPAKPQKLNAAPRNAKDQNRTSSRPSTQVKLPKGSQSRRKQSPHTSDEANLSSDNDDVRDIGFEKTTRLASDEPESEPAPSSPQRRKGRLMQRQRAPQTPPSSDSRSRLSDESDHDVVPVLTTIARKSKKRVLVNSEDEEEPPTRRRLVRGKARKHSSEEEDDPLDGVEAEQRRKGIAPDPEPEIIEDSDEESTSREDDPSAPFRLARPDGEDLPDIEPEEVDDSFIVEDDDEAVAVELPSQFSRQSHQDLSMHFKVICQLFVHLAVQEPEDREHFRRKEGKKEYFALSFNALDRKLGAIRDSLVRSSVWKEPFTKALNTFPEFEVSDLDSVVPQCDACHLGGRLSTFSGRVSGSPYSKVSFQSEELDEDDGDNEDSEGEDRHHREFYLGRFCAQRARVYHSFTHWQVGSSQSSTFLALNSQRISLPKYVLFEGLRAEVDALHGRHNENVSLKLSWGPGIEKPKDPHDADEVMQWLDDRGIIQHEWLKVKRLMEKAHTLDPQRKGGIDDD